MLWVGAVLIAALGQTGRNLAQSGLTRALGALGATQVRFLYGLPFACLFLLGYCLVTGQRPPLPGLPSLGWILLGALAQIAATALMLLAMARQGFAVTTAWIKTEPVLIALFALIVLGETLSPLQVAGIVVATLGVIAAGWRPGQGVFALTPMALGLAAAANFGVSALAFRAGILALPEGGYILRALAALALSLTMQSALLAIWLRIFRPGSMTATLGQWRGSLAAGFLGAFASAFWFIAFALAPAAAVRTLALIEVLFAAVLARLLRGEKPAPRQIAAMAAIVLGVALLLLGH